MHHSVSECESRANSLTSQPSAAEVACTGVRRYPVYLIYWYKSTDTDVTRLTQALRRSHAQARLRRRRRLCARIRRYPVYLLYWYKSTDTDVSSVSMRSPFPVYLLYWYKSADTDISSVRMRSPFGRQPPTTSVYLLFTGTKVQILT